MEQHAQVRLQTDGDGFLSQECPKCRKRFKIRFGEGSDKPVGYCPYCDHSGQQCWWTTEQVEYFTRVAGKKLVEPILQDFAKKINRLNRRDSLLQVKARVSGDQTTPQPPPEPETPSELVTFECCGERVKVESGLESYNCVTCGKRKPYRGALKGS